MTAPGTVQAPGTAYYLTAERLADVIAGHHNDNAAAHITVLADEVDGLFHCPATSTGDEVRASLRAVIAAGRRETPILIGPGGLTAGMLHGGILIDAGPEVYEILATRCMAQAMDAVAGENPDHDLAATLLAEVRLALTLADQASRGTS